MIETRSQRFIAENLRRLEDGAEFLNKDTTLMPFEDFEKSDLKVLVIFNSPITQKTVSATRESILSFFIEQHPNVFVDFAYLPEDKDLKIYDDARMPYSIGHSTRLDASHFDIVGFSISVLHEVVTVPCVINSFSRCDTPIELTWTERKDKILGDGPILYAGGITAACGDIMFGELGDGRQAYLDCLYLGEVGGMSPLVKNYHELRGKVTNQEFVDSLLKHSMFYQPQSYKVVFNDKGQVIENTKINPNAQDFVTPYYPKVLDESISISRTVLNANGDAHSSAQVEASQGAVSEECLIRTQFGFKRLKDLEEVELKVQHSTGIGQVSKIYKQGIRKGLKFKTRLGLEFCCTKDHPMEQFTLPRGSYFEEAQNLKVGDALNIPLDAYQLAVNDNYTPAQARFLGRMVGDGHYNHTMYLSCDPSEKEDCLKLLEDARISHNGGSLKERHYRFIIHAKDLDGRDVRKFYGLDENYEYRTKFFPKTAFSLNVENRIQFILGYLDADSSWSEGKLVLASASKEFMKIMQQFMLSVGVVARFSDEKPQKRGENSLGIDPEKDMLCFKLTVKKSHQGILKDSLKYKGIDLAVKLPIDNWVPVDSGFRDFVKTLQGISTDLRSKLFLVGNPKVAKHLTKQKADKAGIKYPNYYFDEIIEIEDWEGPVMDLTVLGDEKYIADGVSVHNCSASGACNFCMEGWYCIPKGTPIKSGKGITKIEDFQVGDSVVLKGAQYLVEDVVSLGKREAVTLVTETGARIPMAKTHLMLVKEGEGLIFKRAHELVPGDILVYDSSKAFGPKFVKDAFLWGVLLGLDSMHTVKSTVLEVVRETLKLQYSEVLDLTDLTLSDVLNAVSEQSTIMSISSSRVPEDMFNANEESVNEFLKGYNLIQGTKEEGFYFSFKEELIQDLGVLVSMRGYLPIFDEGDTLEGDQAYILNEDVPVMPYSYYKIVGIEETPDLEMCDISVEKEHAYSIQGWVSHNTGGWVERGRKDMLELAWEAKKYSAAHKVKCYSFNCVDKSTAVITDRGIVPAFKLKNEDRVLNPKGEWSSHKGISSKKNQDIFSILTNSAISLRVTHHHRQTVIRNGVLVEVKADEVLEGDKLIVPVGNFNAVPSSDFDLISYAAGFMSQVRAFSKVDFSECLTSQLKEFIYLDGDKLVCSNLKVTRILRNIHTTKTQGDISIESFIQGMIVASQATEGIVRINWKAPYIYHAFNLYVTLRGKGIPVRMDNDSRAERFGNSRYRQIGIQSLNEENVYKDEILSNYVKENLGPFDGFKIAFLTVVATGEALSKSEVFDIVESSDGHWVANGVVTHNTNYVTDYTGLLYDLMKIYPTVNFLNMRLEELGRDTDKIKMMKLIGSNRISAPIEGISQRIRNNYLNKNLSQEALDNFMNHLIVESVTDIKVGMIVTGQEENEDFEELTEYLLKLRRKADSMGKKLPIRLKATVLVHYDNTPLEFMEKKACYNSYKGVWWMSDEYYTKLKEAGVRVKVNGFRQSTMIEQCIISLGRSLTKWMYEFVIKKGIVVSGLNSLTDSETLSALFSHVDDKTFFAAKDMDTYISISHRIRLAEHGSMMNQAIKVRNLGKDAEQTIRCLATVPGCKVSCKFNVFKDEPLKVYTDVKVVDGKKVGDFTTITGCERCDNAEERKQYLCRSVEQTKNSLDIQAAPRIPKVLRVRFHIYRKPEYDLLSPNNTSHSAIAKLLQESDVLLKAFHSVETHNFYRQSEPDQLYAVSGMQVIDTIWSEDVYSLIKELIPVINSKLKTVYVVSAVEKVMEDKMSVGDYNVFRFESTLPFELFETSQTMYRGEIKIKTNDIYEKLIDKSLNAPSLYNIGGKVIGYFTLPFKYNPYDYMKSFLAGKISDMKLKEKLAMSCVMVVRESGSVCKCGKESAVVSLVTPNRLPLGIKCLTKALVSNEVSKIKNQK